VSVPAHVSLVVETQGPVTAAHFEGRDIVLGEGAAREAVEGLSRLGGATLVLSLAGVIALDSAALAQFVRLRKNLRAAGGGLVLCGLSPAVHDRFARTGLAQYLDIRPAPPT
jgi:anti-anti-sigma factor